MLKGVYLAQKPELNWASCQSDWDSTAMGAL